MSSTSMSNDSPVKGTKTEGRTQEGVGRDEMIIPEEKPTELQLMMRMFSMDRQERIERDQRMDSMMEHLFDSHSKLAERLEVVSEDIERIQQTPAAVFNTTPTRDIALEDENDDENEKRKGFPPLKQSPIDKDSD